MTNIDLSFIDTWQNITTQEHEAIQRLKEGIEIIFNNISKDEIIALYLKGSFPRREMKEDSDVDVVTIVSSENALITLRKLQQEYRHEKKFLFEFSGYALQELKTGQFLPEGKKTRAGTARFVRHIPHYKLLYGKALDTNTLFTKPIERLYKGFIKTFPELFLPLYHNKKMSFQDIIKQVFWLTELEIATRNKEFQFTTWQAMTNFVTKNHILHEALLLRQQESIDKATKEAFINRLQAHLNTLNKINKT